MKKVIGILLSVVLIMCVFSGCGKSYSADKTEAYNGYSDYGYDDYSYLQEDAAPEPSSQNSVSDSANVSGDAANVSAQRKLIKTISMSVETKSYDEYIQKLRSQIDLLGGYTERFDESQTDDTRYCYVTVRIPEKSTDDFVNTASQNATVNKRTEEVQDVTETYVDIQARLRVLKAEEQSLVEILEAAQNIEDIITIRERLANIRADIESYEANIRSLDSRINFSTIELSIREVAREVKTESYWGKIGSNISNGFADVIDSVTTAFMLLLSAIPYLIIPAIIAVVVIVLVKRSSKKRKQRALDNPPAQPVMPYNPPVNQQHPYNPAANQQYQKQPNGQPMPAEQPKADNGKENGGAR